MEYIVIYREVFGKKFLVRKTDECVDILEDCDVYYDDYVEEEGKGNIEVEGTEYFWHYWEELEDFKKGWESGDVSDAELTSFGDNLEEAIGFLLD